jgi:sarcosine/dimethylglycine N-methyltransferase
MERIADLVRTYDEHPLRASTILERVAEELPEGSPIREDDLASDPISQITDQNHAGGLAFVNALAIAANITPDDSVLDVGAGLGGSARVIAETFRARVTCLDISASRCQDAIALNARVGLAQRVAVREGDFLSLDLTGLDVSVVWSQASWNHFWDKKAYIDRCVQVLGPGGRLALEDTVVVRLPQNEDESSTLEALQADWISDFPTPGDITALMTSAGFEVSHHVDCSEAFVSWYDGLLAAAARYRKPIADRELRGWRAAAELGRRGLIGYHRFVARRIDGAAR